MRQVLPGLDGRLDGIASRVAVADGSVVDLFTELDKTVDVNAVHEATRSAAAAPRFAGVLEYTEEPGVSSDISNRVCDVLRIMAGFG